MDQQTTLSGFTEEHPDGTKYVWDFTTEPWTVTHYGPDGEEIERHNVDTEGKKIPGTTVWARPVNISATDENADWIKHLH